MGIETSLLLVVDVQNGFINGETERVLAPINELIEHWRKKSQPVVFSRFINPAGGMWEKLRQWKDCRDEPEISLHPDLDKGDNLVIDKKTYSAWGADVADICKERGIGTVTVCGVDTNECVLATAIDIFDAGLRPVVVADACASKGQAFHTAALKLLEVLLGKEQVVNRSSLVMGEKA